MARLMVACPRLLIDRDPVKGVEWIENTIDVRSLDRMGVALAECVITCLAPDFALHHSLR